MARSPPAASGRIMGTVGRKDIIWMMLVPELKGDVTVREMSRIQVGTTTNGVTAPVNQ